MCIRDRSDAVRQFAVTWYLEDQVKEELAENGAEAAYGDQVYDRALYKAILRACLLYTSSVSILTGLNFSSYLSTVCFIACNSVFDFLVNLFCDCSQLPSDSSCKVGVISKGIGNFLKSIKYLWCRTRCV